MVLIFTLTFSTRATGAASRSLARSLIEQRPALSDESAPCCDTEGEGEIGAAVRETVGVEFPISNFQSICHARVTVGCLHDYSCIHREPGKDSRPYLVRHLALAAPAASASGTNFKAPSTSPQQRHTAAVILRHQLNQSACSRQKSPIAKALLKHPHKSVPQATVLLIIFTCLLSHALAE
jgi:hypothetical protein